ncbi:MAG: BrnT family toxin [Alphaproteobacteria bacterium]|nr:BrnT family toxin [Alphaproteobacteria bacterium]
MQIEFDPAKSPRNLRERGLPFAAAARLFDGPRLEWEDRRKDYGEVRLNTLGEIEGRIFFATFTRREEAIRIISFRKAIARETRFYRQHFGK